MNSFTVIGFRRVQANGLQLSQTVSTIGGILFELFPIFDYAKKRVFPNLNCPLKGTDGQVNNFSIKLEEAAVIPDGSYRYHLLFKDDADSEIFSINLTHSVRNTDDMKFF